MFENLYDNIKILVKGLILRFNLAGEVQAYISSVAFPPSNTGRVEILGKNIHRQGFIIYNKSQNSIFVALSSDKATENHFTKEIGAYSSWDYIPTAGAYRGQVTFNPSVVGEGKIVITELVNELDLEVDL